MAMRVSPPASPTEQGLGAEPADSVSNARKSVGLIGEPHPGSVAPSLFPGDGIRHSQGSTSTDNCDSPILSHETD